MWKLICPNYAELRMALFPYLFVPMHMVKVCPMLLKIGHILEIYGTGKWEAELLGEAIGLTGNAPIMSWWVRSEL